MPFGVRDVLLIIRAKDQASSVIRGVGTGLGQLGNDGMATAAKLQGAGVGLLSLGAGIGAIGASAGAFFESALKAAVDFDQQSRLTLSQVNQFQGSLKEVEQIALDVAAAVPVPFKEIQPALFDIFSSIPVNNMVEAKTILEEMSKAAVAGATDIKVVGLSNYEIMNAFGLKATDLNHILDVQFKLVQLGIGHYADINSNIGRLAPTAKIAGQSIDTMGGSLAFMTKITGDGSQAVTSLNRAMESITNPKVAKKFQELGVQVADANGQFRPFKDIVNDLSAALSNMDPQQKAAAIFDLFRSSGSGSLNTRRFFMAAISNLELFNQTLDDVGNNAGAMENAFSILADAPAAKIEKLNNLFEIMKVDLGQGLLPVIEPLTAWLGKLLTWFNELDPSTQALIGQIGAAISIFLIVSGVVLAFSGALLLVIGTMAALVGSVGLAIAILAIIPIILAAIVAGVIYLIANWDTMGPKIQQFATDAAARLEEFRDRAAAVWDHISAWASARMDELSTTLSNTWDHIHEPIARTLHNIQSLFKTVFSDIAKWWNQNGKRMLKELTDAFGDAWKNILAIIQPVSEAIINIVNLLVTFLQAAWDQAHDHIFFVIEEMFRFIVETFKDMIEIFTGVIGVISNLINGDWSKAWEAAKQVVDGVWDFIMETIRNAISVTIGLILFAVDAIVAPFRWLYDVLIGNSIIPDLINGIVWWFTSLPQLLLNVLWNAINWLAGIGADIVTGLWNGVWSMIGWLVGQVASIGSWIVGAFGDAYGILHDVAVNIIVGFWQAISSMWDWLWGKISGFFGGLWDGIKGFLGIGSPSKQFFWLGTMLMQGLANGISDAANMPQDALNNLNLNVGGVMGSGTSGFPLGTSGGNATQIQIGAGAIQIYDARDPDTVAKTVRNTLEDLIVEIARR